MIEPIKIEGLDGALAKLELKSGDLVLVYADISNQLAQAFRRQLLDRLPLDIHIPGVVILQPDQRLETISPKPGDVLIVYGAVAQGQMEHFRANMKAAIPGLVAVENLPSQATVSVEEPAELPPGKVCSNCGGSCPGPGCYNVPA